MKISDLLISVFVNSKCICCKKNVSKPYYYFCNNCVKNISLTSQIVKCNRCHYFLYHNKTCSNCKNMEIHWDELQTLFSYQDKNLKKLYHLYKFQNSHLAEQDLTLLIKKYIILKPDYEIVIIPCGKKTKQRLGFNPVEKIIKNLNYPYYNILEKDFFARNFKILKGEERKKQKKFLHIKKNKNIDLTNKKILLIDDILTTGSTLNHATALLKSHGVAYVSALSFFRN